MISFVHFDKIFVVIWWFFKEFKLRVTFFSLTQSDKKIFANFSNVLCCMLNNSNLCLCNFLWFWCSITIRFGLFDFFENSFKKLSLNILRFFNFYLLYCKLRRRDLLLYFSLDDLRIIPALSLLKKFTTCFSNHMIIISTIRTVLLKESELSIMLLSL